MNLSLKLFFIGKVIKIVQVWAPKIWETLKFEAEIPKTKFLLQKSQNMLIFVHENQG